MIDASYAAAQQRLAAFLPKAGYDYFSQRNYDRPGHPNVSGLSPYIRHRILTEEEVLAATLEQHSPQAAEKFIQEVVWRTYWKGWLELRPSVWTQYQSDLRAALNRVQTESGLRADWEAACKGETGIDCFDHWARDLVTTGYLHNHARMWFASIWIFTLRLPWALGADFFLRHLLDGDPASNTLSWRWVGGLQTRGKTYLASADNIAKYTEGRFQPQGLATTAIPLEGPEPPAPLRLPAGEPINRTARTGLLVTEEDLSPFFFRSEITPSAVAYMHWTADRSPLTVAQNVTRFVDDALADARSRQSEMLGQSATPDDLVTWATEAGVTQIVTAFVPTGPAADALRALQPRLRAEGITLVQRLRSYDRAAWPFATKGFFAFKDIIPDLLDRIAR